MPRNRRHARSGRGYKQRRTNAREPKQRFLIVCEGEETEPNYFRAFRVPAVVINVLGRGEDPLSLVETARQKRSEGDYDQVWVVFDRDDVPVGRFNRAFFRADELDVGVVYSNQAFELWYVLHFEYTNTARRRDDYVNRLNVLMGRPYSKRDPNMYEKLLELQPEAIKNATRLLTLYDPPDPANNDPSTTVHLLVEALNKFL